MSVSKLEFHDTFNIKNYNFGVIDLKYVLDNNGKNSGECDKYSKTVQLVPGRYRIDISIQTPNTDSKISQSFELFTTGTLIVGDIGNVFSEHEVGHEKWIMFLHETNYLQSCNRSFYSIKIDNQCVIEVDYAFTKLD